ncbi:hypothetical protein BB8028_0001g04080 [Beauveria bassiana]|uniref:Uncharacterized protein n=1 Tax=Beauveria bassiana TaxID=176275 RepID=A0A2S7XWP8_BEABA|nr:hypothetical protein BB8028_0001g04080 [Beauveria bassiana]
MPCHYKSHSQCLPMQRLGEGRGPRMTVVCGASVQIPIASQYALKAAVADARRWAAREASVPPCSFNASSLAARTLTRRCGLDRLIWYLTIYASGKLRAAGRRLSSLPGVSKHVAALARGIAHKACLLERHSKQHRLQLSRNRKASKCPQHTHCSGYKTRRSVWELCMCKMVILLSAANALGAWRSRSW